MPSFQKALLLVRNARGKVKPPDFTSRSNLVVLNLYSDESLGFRGFKLRYKILCGQAFFSEHGTLLFNENEPHISETNTCEYELITTPDKYLDLNFTINELMLTTVDVLDHGEVIRSLRRENDYRDMDVRVISTSNVLRLRFTYQGLSEGHAVIAYQAHPRAVVSGDPVFLFHMQTCRGLITTVSRSAPQGGITGFWFIDGQGGIAGFWHMADGQGGIARFWHMTEGRGRYSRVLAHGREKGEVEGFWFTAERKGRWQATQFWFTAGKQAGRQEGGRVGFRRCCHREGANC